MLSLQMAFRRVYSHLNKNINFIKSIVGDKILSEIDIDTASGNKYFYCQVRMKKNGNKYVVFKSRGGDATVFVGLDRKSIDSLIIFLNEQFLSEGA